MAAPEKPAILPRKLLQMLQLNEPPRHGYGNPYGTTHVRNVLPDAAQIGPGTGHLGPSLSLGARAVAPVTGYVGGYVLEPAV
jgi:hypothetical protein